MLSLIPRHAARPSFAVLLPLPRNIYARYDARLLSAPQTVTKAPIFSARDDMLRLSPLPFPHAASSPDKRMIKICAQAGDGGARAQIFTDTTQRSQRDTIATRHAGYAATARNGATPARRRLFFRRRFFA